MAFDGIITQKVVYELQNIIGCKIDKIYEPDKNNIILGLYGKSINLSLQICISAQNYRLHLTSNSPKNPKNAPNFCMLLRKHLLGYKIKQIYSIDLERIIFIDLQNNENPNKPIFKTLIIELMGRHSNIVLTDQNYIIIDCLRHTSTEENSYRDMYPTAKYIFPEPSKYSFIKLQDFNDFYLKINNYLSKNLNLKTISTDNIDTIISNTFNGISKSFIRNIVILLKITDISKTSLELIYFKIKEIINYHFVEIQFSIDNDFFPFTYPEENINEKIDMFSVNLALDKFYYKKETIELFTAYRNSMLNLILESLKKYKKRLVNIDNKILDSKNKDIYRLYGELITSNLYKIPNKNLKKIELENYYNNNEIITIPLNSMYLPSYNAKLYFKKYSKLKNSLDIVNKQKEETISDINYIESVVYEITSATDIADLEEIYNEILDNNILLNKTKINKNFNKKLHNNKPAQKMSNNKFASFNPLKYVINEYTIFVGRNNVENDYLTCKFAKKNDIWFHTKDTHGSHVILKTGTEKKIPDEIIYEAAKLAVKHSKAKNSSHTPVDYCEVLNVKKPSGSKPGFVIYTNNKTIYV